MKNKKGFTLVELLVVISIIGILTIVSVSSYINAQIKARDAQRKSDLDGLSKALMMYYNDNGKFPTKDVIQFGYGDENGEVGFTGSNAIIYMREMPIDPLNKDIYVYDYETDSTFTKFNIYANLESKNDSQCQNTYTIGGKNYCYGIASPNATVDPSQF